MPEHVPDIAPWLQLGFGFVVAWYLLTKAMPRAEERADKRDAAFLESLSKERDGRKADSDKIVAAVEHGNDRVLDALNGQPGGRSNGSGRG